MGALARRAAQLTTRERAAARELTRTDPRLAVAVADPDRFGFAQTLAGAHELLEHYRTALPMAQLLLDAAADSAASGTPTTCPSRASVCMPGGQTRMCRAAVHAFGGLRPLA